MGGMRYDAVLLGANWDNGANSGSRSANWNNSPSNSNGNIGGRGLSDDSGTYGSVRFNLGARDASGSISLPYIGLIGEFIRYVGRTYEADNTLDTNVTSKFS